MKRCAFTVGSLNYLPYFKTLGQSVAKNNPEIEFFVLIIDEKNQENEKTISDANLKYYWLEDHVKKEWITPGRKFYTPFELCNATKPVAHRVARDEIGADEWLYLDSDIFVLSSLEKVFGEEPTASAILYPHALTPFPVSGSLVQEMDWLRFGTYNGGALLCRRGENTNNLIQWWEERLRYFCFDREDGLYVDQKWLDLVPSFFKGIAISNLLSFNVAYWNFHERELSLGQNNEFLLNNEPLIAYHFSKWKIGKSNFVQGSEGYHNETVWRELSSLYKKELIKNGLNPSGKMQGYSGNQGVVSQVVRKYWQYIIVKSTLVERENPIKLTKLKVLRFVLTEMKKNWRKTIKDLLAVFSFRPDF